MKSDFAKRKGKHDKTLRIDDAIAADDIEMVSKLVNGKHPANALDERKRMFDNFKILFCL